MAVITDRKRPLFKQSQVFSGGSGALFGTVLGGLSSLVNTFQAFVPEIVSTTEYYPFGMTMPGKSFNAGNYHFGFNGVEKDDEIKGAGNSLSFKFRIYDSRLGKFLSPDPLIVNEQKFQFYSPYQFAGNKPIQFIDLWGLQEGLPWYLRPNAQGGKPVLTLGLHILKLPVYQREDGALNVPSNLLGGGWNGVAITFNEAMAGKSGSTMLEETVRGTEELLERSLEGDINQADLEAGALILVTRKHLFEPPKEN